MSSIANIESRLPPETRPIVHRLLAEPLVAADRQRAEFLRSVEEIGASARSEVPEVAQVACRYLITVDDAERDLASSAGLDDDQLVIEAVCEALGMPAPGA